MIAAVLFLVAGLVTGALTEVVRRYALSRNLVDVPNERSSHLRPTPRGGGIAIVVVVLGFVLAARFAGLLGTDIAVGLLGGGLIVAGAGWLDDQKKISTIKRFGAHVVASVWAISWLGGLSVIHFGPLDVHAGPVGSVFAALFVIWFINLYNFMDGIDGLAGINAVTVGLVAAILLVFEGDQSLFIVAVTVAGAAAGFLGWNWSPAKVFMGDVGSGFLGFVFATLALASSNEGRLSLIAWILLLGVFVVDATCTLARRVLRREVWYAPHRSHAYQRIVRAGYPHARVSIGVGIVNVVLGVIVFFTLISPSSTLPLGATALAVVIGLYFVVERIQPM